MENDEKSAVTGSVAEAPLPDVDTARMAGGDVWDDLATIFKDCV